MQRKHPGIPSGSISLKLPEIENFIVNRGLNTYFIKNTKLPIIQLLMILHSGSLYDGENKKGLAYSTSMLIDEGAGEYDALEIDKEFERLGTSFNIAAGQDYTTLKMLSLKENFDRSLKILSDIIKSPRLEKNDFERVKNEQINRIKQNNNDPAYLASNFMDKLVFSKTNYEYPVLGTIEDLDNVELGDIKKFYHAHFTPGNSSLIVVGNCEIEYLTDKLNSYFDGWDRIKKETYPAINFHESERRIYLFNKEGAVQSEIRTGHLCGKRNSPDFHALSVMNTILGGQFSSRINRNLREEKGFTYGAHSYFDYNKEGGAFGVSTSVKTENTSDALREIMNETESIRAGIEPEEVQFAKNYLIRRYPLLFETYGQIARNIGTKIIFSLPDSYFDDYVRNIKELEDKEIEDAAKKNIRPENLISVIVGDLKRILPGLKNTFEEGIIELLDPDDLTIRRSV